MASLDCTLVVVVASPVAVAVVMADAVELAEPVVDGSGVADDNPDAAAADVATAAALAAGTQSLPAAAGALAPVFDPASFASNPSSPLSILVLQVQFLRPPPPDFSPRPYQLFSVMFRPH